MPHTKMSARKERKLFFAKKSFFLTGVGGVVLRVASGDPNFDRRGGFEILKNENPKHGGGVLRGFKFFRKLKRGLRFRIPEST